jgi:hypothetical protein
MTAPRRVGLAPHLMRDVTRGALLRRADGDDGAVAG